MMETPRQTEESSPAKRSRRGFWLGLVLGGLGLAVLGILGYLLSQNLEGLRQQIVLLQGQVQEARSRAGEASERSQAALDYAAQAEENARQAALERRQAQHATAVAAQGAAQARQEATVAAEETRLARAETERIRQRREAEIERLQEVLGKIADTERTPLGLVMHLGSESVRFDFDKATLRPEERELLSRIAGVLLTAYGFRVYVYGHTDDIGTEQYNQGLSERRAEAVRDYLVKAGIDEKIISGEGFGKSSPRVPASSREARSKNRRVEIGIIDSVIEYAGEVANRAP